RHLLQLIHNLLFGVKDNPGDLLASIYDFHGYPEEAQGEQASRISEFCSALKMNELNSLLAVFAVHRIRKDEREAVLKPFVSWLVEPYRNWKEETPRMEQPTEMQEPAKARELDEEAEIDTKARELDEEVEIDTKTRELDEEVEIDTKARELDEEVEIDTKARELDEEAEIDTNSRGAQSSYVQARKSEEEVTDMKELATSVALETSENWKELADPPCNPVTAVEVGDVAESAAYENGPAEESPLPRPLTPITEPSVRGNYDDYSADTSIVKSSMSLTDSPISVEADRKYDVYMDPAFQPVPRPTALAEPFPRVGVPEANASSSFAPPVGTSDHSSYNGTSAMSALTTEEGEMFQAVLDTSTPANSSAPCNADSVQSSDFPSSEIYNPLENERKDPIAASATLLHDHAEETLESERKRRRLE
ncbi:MAG: hypothetical protein KVP17_000065, partial [Porospora cf. gigantea B]|uniref:uncharacterized protein n=2 Tax=Porospora cf. gigantea B TaxID=2853592 RepID=UPI0035717E3F